MSACREYTGEAAPSKRGTRLTTASLSQCWPIHKTLCKVDPKSFRFPPLPAADIEKLKKIKDESYGGPFTTYVVEGSLLQRIPKFLPPAIPSFSWEVSLASAEHVLHFL